MLSESDRQAAINAVRVAMQLCQNVRSQLDDSASLQKSDLSPVTVADFGAQAIILHALGKAMPEVPAVGEEDSSELRQSDNAALLERVVAEVNAVQSGMSQDEVLAAIDRGAHTGGPTGTFWTLDPIDGTKGFLRSDQYAIALALIKDGEIVFGVLGCPHLPVEWNAAEIERGCLFVAEKGKGCRQLNADGSLANAVRVDEVIAGADAAFCESVESGHSKHDWAAEVAERVGIAKESVRMDSQCKYAAIARGDASIYLRLPTRVGYQEKIWDHAAGLLCVEESGGRVSDIAGKPLDFSKGRTLSENSGVIATNGHLHDAVVEAVQATKPAQ